MQWQDKAIVLSARALAQTGVRLSVLTAEHGRAAGLYRPAARKNGGRHVPQVGDLVSVQWGGRLAEHLGHWRLETVHNHLPYTLANPAKLQAVSAMTSLCDALLPEHHPYPQLYDACSQLVQNLAHPDWMTSYVRFELSLLQDLGFQLDLGRCAVTGTTSNLAYVSPKTGRAVSHAGAGDYASRLLPLPDSTDALGWLKLTGYFLHRYGAEGRRLPAARDTLLGLVNSDDLHAMLAARF
ncbi:MAG: DNA repair protein RecO [Alphaproteobacteria bacterium]|nr:DNA repair protein RecO [Alphaproteobacteria bacterium]